MEPRGARDFSSPQVRVRGAYDFRQYSNQRLRLPNERPPLGPRFRRTIGALLTLAIVGGIGVGVYFGVTLLLEEDEDPVAAVEESVEPDGSEDGAATSVESEPAQTADSSAVEQSATEVGGEQQQSAAADSAAAEPGSAQSTAAGQQSSQTQQSSVAIALIEPTVSEQQVTPAQVGGAEIVAERVTAEPVPSGIPRSLADGAAYDPSEPATVFTARWPVGTTLRLTRLPGATVLSDEEQDQVVGSVAMVVVRGTESSNTDLQLSPAAFEQLAFYGTERIIAVRVEVTAAPP
ncbi:MAG: hypothetical protein OXG42_00820 [Chloroflexi bacterium]|nr:hypothetical protein [Chloroflexota bacterium]